MVVAEEGAILDVLCQKDPYTLIEQSLNSKITCMQYNFMRIIGNDQKNNNGQNFWKILERIIGKNSSIIGIGLGKTLPGCTEK